MSRPGIALPEPMVLPEHDLMARIYRTLGDATRLRVLEYLVEHRTASQTDLVEKIGASQSRLSEHVSILVWCGFVGSQRDGRRMQYELKDKSTEEFIDLARAFLNGNPDAVGGCTPLEGARSGEIARVYGVL